MKPNQNGLETQKPVLDWHREAAAECFRRSSNPMYRDVLESIARHDPYSKPHGFDLSQRIRPNSEAAPWVVDEVKRMEATHAKTLRLLEELDAEIQGAMNNADPEDAPDILDGIGIKIRAHLATQSQPAAQAQKGTQ